MHIYYQFISSVYYVCLSVYISGQLLSITDLIRVQIMSMKVKSLKCTPLRLGMVWNEVLLIFLLLQTWLVRFYHYSEHIISFTPPHCPLCKQCNMTGVYLPQSTHYQFSWLIITSTHTYRKQKITAEGFETQSSWLNRATPSFYRWDPKESREPNWKHWAK